MVRSNGIGESNLMRMAVAGTQTRTDAIRRDIMIPQVSPLALSALVQTT